MKRTHQFDVGSHSWYILYYPEGEGSDDADWISIYLGSDCVGVDGIKAGFKISLLDQDRKPVPKGSTWGFNEFIKRKDLEESSYLRDDIFRVRCDVTVTKEIVVTEPIPPPVLVPPSDVACHLGQLLSSGDAADVTFDVGGETFAAHRFILAARSSVFKAELLGPMKEKTSARVKIEDVEARVFKALLHFTYTDSLPEMDDGDTAAVAQHLIVVADRYNMERLKLICEEKLCNLIDRSTVATTLALAEQHGCSALKKACFQFLASPGNLKAVMASEGFEHLKSSCPSVLEELVAKLAP
ncbi:hypothetical protein BRADI_4g12891v3 [Brachypodium distachyon]|uniref:BTB domain-containing protein n=1 Tax=Brachypodium distachyon TaxID=15368 RepID=A0A0Q3EIX5_BRADI|nr:hypothetical protein BRADI_4g12891v3 [Brachypodium distachyon]